MAEFNPNVPQVEDPVYFHWSKPITTPEPDKSKAIAIRTAGDVLGSAFKEGDEVVKQHLDRQIHAGADQIQDEYITSLKAAHAQLAKQPDQTDENGIPTVDSLTKSGGETRVPPDVKSLEGSASILGEARANNKLSKTAYDARMDALLKDYRARYPGWRDYIDEVGTRVTGTRTPANQYISSLLGDINTFLTNNKNKADKTESLLMRNFEQIPDAPALHAAYKAGKVPAEYVEQRVYDALRKKAQWENDKLALDSLEANNKMQAIHAQGIFERRSLEQFDSYLDTAYVQSVGGPEKFTELMSNWAQGKETPTDLQFKQLGDMLDGARIDIIRHIMREASEPITNEYGPPDPANPSRNKSMIDFLGGTEVASKKAEATADAVLGRYITAIRQKDVGAMYSQHQAIRAMSDGTLYRAMHDPNYGGYIQMMDAFKGSSPAFLQALETSILTKKMQHPDASFFEAIAGRAAVQPDLRINDKRFPKANGQTYTLSDSLHDIDQPGPPGSPPLDNQSLKKEVLNLTDYLASGQLDDNAREGLAKFFYDNTGKSLEVMDNFTEADKFRVFSQMTRPAITQQMYEAGANRPDVWRNYKDWAETTFGRKIFSTSINNLADYKDIPGIQVTYHSNQDYHYFTADLAPRPGQALPADYFARAKVQQTRIQEELNRLNTGLNNVANVARVQGENVDGYLLRLLGTVSGSNVIPQMMLKSVLSSRPPKASSNLSDQEITGVQRQ